MLLAFKQRQGHSHVPDAHKENDFRLGQWVGVQRQSREKMPLERSQRLDHIGFDWDRRGTAWEDGFTALLAFQQRERHCRVPQLHKEDDYALGVWASAQRRSKNKMSPERRRRLDEIDFDWDPLETVWEFGFAALLLFKQREGHCRVPHAYKEEQVSLGGWVLTQRQSKAKMSLERRQRLDDIGFDWDPFTTYWEEGFAALVAFKQREGHCRVPYTFKQNEYALGVWVTNRRRRKDKMSLEQRQRLDDIGFDWDLFTTDWEQGFAALLAFKQREGHCRVPSTHKESDFALGRWVGAQRQSTEKMSSGRRQRLNDVGFEWKLK